MHNTHTHRFPLFPPPCFHSALLPVLYQTIARAPNWLALSRSAATPPCGACTKFYPCHSSLRLTRKGQRLFCPCRCPEACLCFLFLRAFSCAAPTRRGAGPLFLCHLSFTPPPRGHRFLRRKHDRPRPPTPVPTHPPSPEHANCTRSLSLSASQSARLKRRCCSLLSQKHPCRDRQAIRMLRTLTRTCLGRAARKRCLPLPGRFSLCRSINAQINTTQPTQTDHKTRGL